MNFIFTLLLISVCEVQSLKCYLCVWTSLGNIVNPGWKDAYNDNCREADKEMKIKNCFKYATGCIALSSKLSDGAEAFWRGCAYKLNTTEYEAEHGQFFCKGDLCNRVPYAKLKEQIPTTTVRANATTQTQPNSNFRPAIGLLLLAIGCMVFFQ